MYPVWWLVGVVHLLVWCSSTLQTMVMVQAIPPLPPVQCNGTVCTLNNAYGTWGDRNECLVSNVEYPTSEEELRLTVAHANKNKLKVKVVSKFGHAVTKLACPSTTQSRNSLLISTAKYDSNIEIDPDNLAVTVDAGVALRDLIDKVEEAGLSLVAAPYWEGLSVAGLISTGSHGSSWWGNGGAVHDQIIGISLIVPASKSEGYAKIIQIGPQDELLNAAKVSLGVLGVISKFSAYLF